MRITEVYADAVGATHFREIPIQFKSRDFAPPSAPIDVSPETPMTTGVFLELPSGWDPNHHSTPRPQWVIVLRGHLKITVTDGAVTDFQSGDVFFLNDENSRGHQTVVQGQQSALLFLVGLAD
jgi:quercetin dioxygenase-like cupin family protein